MPSRFLRGAAYGTTWPHAPTKPVLRPLPQIPGREHLRVCLPGRVVELVDLAAEFSHVNFSGLSDPGYVFKNAVCGSPGSGPFRRR
jgi:hypothetical protein